VNTAIDPSVGAALRHAHEMLRDTSESPRLDAEVLLGTVLKCSRAWLYANPESTLTPAQRTAFEEFLAQRRRGKPVAHLTGEREFWSLPLRVDATTLVPRPETELLVETALRLAPAGKKRRILDLGTGSGAIAIALAVERPACAVTATDISAAALDLAARNVAALCPGHIRLHAGDWFAALPPGTPKFDIIVSNPPYIAATEAGATGPELEWEPQDALYAGVDGLDAIRRIAAAAPDWLSPGGWLLLEHGFAQQVAVSKLLRAAKFESVEYAADLAGIPRVSYGRQRQHTG